MALSVLCGPTERFAPKFAGTPARYVPPQCDQTQAPRLSDQPHGCGISDAPLCSATAEQHQAALDQARAPNKARGGVECEICHAAAGTPCATSCPCRTVQESLDRL